MITITKVPSGYPAHGTCALGPVHRTGDTEQEAIHAAKLQIREMLNVYCGGKLVEFRAKFPGYRVGSFNV